MKYLTIFTPTYNRAELLLDLYKSLCEQINKNFLWLIIDDGSSDNTKELVNKWKKENKIEIQYIYQKNSGKHVAHNKAVELCNTELFVCVDSDDILTNNAVEIINNYWENDKKNNNIDFVAYCSRKGDLSGNPTGERWIDDKRKISFFDLYEKHKYRGELVLIWISRILKQYSFPVFENEKFVTENVLYYQISYDKPIKLINDVFYLFEYKQDGYTKQGEKLYYKNPYGYAIYRYQVGYLSLNLLKKVRWIARYKGWIKAFKLNKNLLKFELEKMNLKKVNIVIDVLSDMYALSYRSKYRKKNKNIYLEHKMNIIRKKIIYGNNDIKNNYFHIVFGVDDVFIRPLGVLMTSIIKNNKNENIAFHIISKEIKKENKKIIQQFAINNNIVVYIYIIDENIFKNLPKTEYISHATYNRFLIPNILKDITDKVLYLDADIICLNNIKLLKNFNIDDNIVGVVEESNKYVEKQQIKELELTSNKYFNAGVMYINIKEWINFNINDKILNLLKSKEKFMFNDQDILNIVLENKCIYMDKIYNYEFDVGHKSNRYIYNLPENIVFLHYVGKFKPWQKWCMHPAKKFFEKYASISLWKDIPLDEPKTYKQMKHMGKSYAIYNKKLKSIYWYLKYAVYKIKSKL